MQKVMHCEKDYERAIHWGAVKHDYKKSHKGRFVDKKNAI